ncbi:MAG: LytTR family DNA-binding domain-containing protein [Pseudomonadota bacterium]
MKKLKTLIVDDEPLIRSELRSMLERLDTVEVLGESASASEALKLLGALDYDLVFLDIQMPGLTGLEVAEKLKSHPRPPQVIFVTAYSRYAPKAFDLDAADYILKPFDEDRLAHAVRKAVQWREIHFLRHAGEKTAGQRDAGASTPPEPLEGQDAAGLNKGWGQDQPRQDSQMRLERLPVDRGGKTALIPYQDIVFAKAYEDYSYVFTARESFLTSFSLKMLEERFKSGRFFRAHRKFLVNLDQVTEIISMPGGNFVLHLKGVNKMEIPLSRRRVKYLKRIIGL